MNTAQLTPRALDVIADSGECTDPVFRSSKGSGMEFRNALRELLDAWMCEMPSSEHGQAAQDAWADRRARARRAASELLAISLVATGEPS